MNTQLSHEEFRMTSAVPRRHFPANLHPSDPRKIVLVLSVCMAIQMTSFVMIMPLFARRLGEFGAGVEALGASAMAYALTSSLAAPFMGALADRYGRRPLVLVALGAYVLAFTGYLVVSSAPGFILLRGLAGAFTAGLLPAVSCIVTDLAPVDRRAQWIGFVNGGAAVGWIAGPLLGGLFYDRWGYQVPFMISILMAVVTFLTALLAVPETRGNPNRPVVANKPNARSTKPVNLMSSTRSFRASLPGSLRTFTVLLGVYFAVIFAWAFIEPRFMFYAYDELGWSASLLGLVMSTFGIAMVVGEFTLSRLSDRMGRKPVIILGLALFSAQFIGLAFSRDYVPIALAFIVGGLGNALLDPALSAHILDISPGAHQARTLGVKSAAGSLGNILGPALVVLFNPLLKAQGVFLVATGIVFLAMLAGTFIKAGLKATTAGPSFPLKAAEAD